MIKKLSKAHADYKSRLPDIRDAEDLCNCCLSLLLPHYRNQHIKASSEDAEEYCLRIFENLEKKLEEILSGLQNKYPLNSSLVFEQFNAKLEALQTNLLLDAEAINKGDPAASDMDEVILAYPGFKAIAVHRIAHEFYALQVPLLPRLLSEYAHRETGIDIHPGAQIGKHFCIDHGTGIVIGETTVIKDKVKMYQGVTLGALSVEKSLADKKRHPTIEEDVVIYSNATILGGGTVIGKNSIIGGNVWITESVPENSIVYHTGHNKFKNNL